MSSILPFLPLIFSSNVITISWEWSNHLHPLINLHHPISPKTLSEIFRRSYLNGASSFLLSLLGSIFSSAYLCWSMWEKTGARAERLRLLHMGTAVFGVLHLFPFSAIIVRFVARACDGKGASKHEREVKSALGSWLRVNRWRMWMDLGAMSCALAAVIERTGSE